MSLVFRQFFLFKLAVLVSVLTLAGWSFTAQAETSHATSDAIVLDVYKDANCGCCDVWLEHADERGFNTQPHNIANLFEFKLNKGIAAQYQSCHTSVSAEGYVFEGHIPARFIHAFLDSPPANAIGLTVPAMPVGSPGMEYQDKFRPYQVLLLKKDGSTEVFARVNSLAESIR